MCFVEMAVNPEVNINYNLNELNELTEFIYKIFKLQQ